MFKVIHYAAVISCITSFFLLSSCRKKEGKKQVNEIIIEALIDDLSEIWLTSEGIYWKHNTRYAKPRLHDGRNEPTLVNGKEWFPVWSRPDRERGIDT